MYKKEILTGATTTFYPHKRACENRRKSVELGVIRLSSLSSFVVVVWDNSLLCFLPGLLCMFSFLFENAYLRELLAPPLESSRGGDWRARLGELKALVKADKSDEALQLLEVGSFVPFRGAPGFASSSQHTIPPHKPIFPPFA